MHAKTLTHIGKEANQLEDTLTGLVQDQDETLNDYGQDNDLARLREALPLLRELGPREVARRTGLSVSAVQAVLANKARPRAAGLARYLDLAESLDRDG